MANPARQTIFRRKVTYLVTIAVLFVITTFFWRGVASPLTGNVPLPYSVSAQANDLQLSELSITGTSDTGAGQANQADLTGSAIRLMLTGSRGLALAALWYQSDEKKKRHEWNKFEILVRAITKLVPHSPAAWTYQSWNIAYNVSVESDRVSDKYFYIAKGIALMGEGIRLNKDQPDMRWMQGFYYQNKFGVSDEANTLRSLFQLSSVDPRDRDAARMTLPDNSVDLVEFEKFVKANPQLARRLKDKLNYTPERIVEFLREARNIPSRNYDPALDSGRTGPKPKEDMEQFPTLPLERPTTEDDVAWQGSPLNDDFDNYQAARSWMTYAQDPLPKPAPQTEPFDRLKLMQETGKRIPRSPMLVIFRHLPARAQSYVGERLEKEGWFDESGWEVDQDRTGIERWFPNGQVTAGQGVARAQKEWSRAYELWTKHGNQNGIHLDANEKLLLEEKAKAYRERYQVVDRDPGKDISNDPVPAALKDSYLAHRKLYFYESNRGVSNFDFHLYRAQCEKDNDTIQARKMFFDAARLKEIFDSERAIEKYQQAFDQWKKVLWRYPEFRYDTNNQEDSYEIQVRYLRLIDIHRAASFRPVLTVDGMLAQGLAISNGLPIGTIPAGVFWSYTGGIKPLPFPIVGPLDQLDPNGQPWVPRYIADTVLDKLEQRLEKAPTPTAPDQQQSPPPRRAGPQ
jgi:hypothetical protein